MQPYNSKATVRSATLRPATSHNSNALVVQTCRKFAPYRIAKERPRHRSCHPYRWTAPNQTPKLLKDSLPLFLYREDLLLESSSLPSSLVFRFCNSPSPTIRHDALRATPNANAKLHSANCVCATTRGSEDVSLSMIRSMYKMDFT